MKSINSDYDNFVAIDDIVYEAILCSEATDAWDLGSNFYSSPMLSALIERPIFSTKVKSFLHIFLLAEPLNVFLKLFIWTDQIWKFLMAFVFSSF